MTHHHTAHGLASLGRHGDTMLVHMSPKEVAGLQGLAKSHGTSLTINPETGLPEAFSLGGVLGAVAPIAAGAMFPEFAPGFIAPGVAAGALTGALIAAASGQDPFMGGVSGGFGGYGGAGLSESAMKLGTPASGVSAAEANKGITQQFLSDVQSGARAGSAGVDLNSYLANPNQYMNPQAAIGTGTQGIDLAKATMPANLSTSTFNTALQPDILGNLTDLPTTTGSVALKGGKPAFDLGIVKDTITSRPLDVMKDYGLGKSALMGASTLAAGLEPSDLGYGNKPYYDPDTGKWRGPQGQLNLSDQWSTGLNLGSPGMKLAAKGGEIKSYAIGGNVANQSTGMGISDLYNATDGAGTPNISQDGFGIGRLAALARQQSMNEAKTMGYAMGGLTSLKQGGEPGGYLDGAGDGMSDSIPATIEGKQPARLADGEFVIPADVVSHLGNGSSKAGSQRLYSMLDKVRKARTGHTKQGKQIKAEKYLPA